MRKSEKEGKTFQSRIPFIVDPGKKIQKKIAKKFEKSKNPFPAIFLARIGCDRLRKREKNLVPNFVHTQPGQENSEKNRKRNQKIKKPLSCFIFSQNRIRQGKKEKKKILVPNSVHTRPGRENSEKNSKKIKKPLCGIIFSQNGIRQAEKDRKKILVPNSVTTQPELENSKINTKN